MIKKYSNIPNKFDRSASSPDSGYAALLTVLVIGAVLIILTLSITFISLNTLLSSSTHQLSSQSLVQIEGCVQEALLQLKNNNSLPAQVILPEITCQINNISQTGNDWSFQVTGNYQGFSKTIDLQATRDTQLTLTGWTVVD